MSASQALLGAALGVFVGALALGAALWMAVRRLREARRRAARILAEARREAEARAAEMLASAQERALQLSEEIEQRRRSLDEQESALEARSQELQRRTHALRQSERALERERHKLEQLQHSAARDAEAARQAREQAEAELVRVAGLGREEARAELLRQAEEQARAEVERRYRKIEEEAREEAERRAMELVVQAAERLDARRAVETTVTYIELPNDEMKGRIIGREGRNIRALEALTGIDLIVDDTPRSIVISSFDALRREIARIAIERLIEDGRIHPARIEEVVQRVREEMDVQIEQRGAAAAYELGIPNLHPRLNRLVGRMGFHTHHGQQLLQHCVETARLAGYMAAELGARAELARRAGLLHEIGRVEEGVQGPVFLASAELAARYGEQQAVVQCIRAMHREAETRTVEAMLLRVAKRISAARPGARRENLEIHIERLRRLEQLAETVPGVQRAFAVKAGRELRVIVSPEQVRDADVPELSRRIARMVEQELAFSGRIKIDVIRETRAVQYAL